MAAPLRFKLDENVPVDAAARVRGAGHDVHTVADEALAGAPDAQLVSRCRREGRVLVTLDLDFADVRQYPPAETPGIVVLRPGASTIAGTMALVDILLRAVATEPVEGHLWVVEPGRVRVRGGSRQAAP